MNIGISSIDAKKGMSATLIAIFLLSALAMAAMIAPAGAATAGTITASSDYIYGNMVIQVTVSDADLTAANTPMPSVTVSKSLKITDDTVAQGTNLPMYQAVGGSWVGFIALGGATVAALIPGSAPPQDGTEPTGNGEYVATWGDGIAKEPWSAAATPLTQANINNIISYVQSPGSSFTITYNDADPASSPAVTVTVDYSTGSISFDRTTYPPGATVYASITDADLNLDPTAKDVLGGNSTAAGYFYANVTPTGSPQPVIIANGTETGPKTGVFQGKVTVSATANSGDVLTTTYTEADPSASRVASAVIATNTGSVALDKSEYIVSDTATVTLTDPDMNKDSKAQEQVTNNADTTLDNSELLVRSSGAAIGVVNSDLFLTLTETGVNTGVFTKTFKFSMAGALGKLNVTTGSVITAIYKDAATATATTSNRTTSSIFATNTGSMALDADSYGSSSVATFTVTDPDLNVNTAVNDRIETTANLVNVYSSTDSTNKIQPLAVETGASTGVFQGSFTFNTSATTNVQATEKLAVRSGDTVYAKYMDAKSSAGSAYTSTATASFSTSTNTGTIVLDQSAYSAGTITAAGAGEYIKVTVTDPDMNLKSTEIEIKSADTAGTATAPTADTALVKYSRTYLQIYDGNTKKGNDMGIQLKETGSNTGVFSGKIQLNATGMTTFVTSGMVAQVVYKDAADAAGSAASAIATAAVVTNTGVLTIDNTEPGIGESMKITLTEPDANLDYALIETVAADATPATKASGYVYAYSTSDPNGVSPALTESAIDSGVFTATIKFGAASAGTTLQAKRGDTVTVVYKDRLNGQGVAASISQSAKIKATTGSVSLDKAVYSPYNRVTITITDPDVNADSTTVDQITNTLITLKTTTMTSAVSPTSAIAETGVNTGVFVWKVTLEGPSGTTYAADHGDGLAISYTEDTDATGARDVAHNVYATVSHTTGTVELDQANYESTDTATITVTDPDQNSNPGVLNSFNIKVISTTDGGGINIGVMETGLNTGVFTTTFTFTTTTASTGGILRVTIGDTVTAKYTDTTADPADIAGWVAGQAKTKVVSATATVGAAAVTETPITSTTPALQDQSGNALTQATKGTMVLLASDMSNTGATDQAMLYIVQVKDSAGSVVSLSFISGTVPAGATYTFGMPWTPTDAGDFTVEVFAWTSWTDPTPLSAEVSTSTVTVA